MTIQPPERFSQTFLRRWTLCARLAHLEREAGITGRDAAIGHAFHAIQAAVGTAVVIQGGGQSVPAEAERIAVNVLSTPQEGQSLTREDHDDVLDLVRSWAPRAEFYPDERFEVFYENTLDGQRLSAKVDRLRIVGDRAFVIDAKTGHGKPAESPTVQGDIYAWHVLRAHSEVEVVQYHEDFVRFNVTPDPFDYWRDDIYRVEDWLRTRIRLMHKSYATGTLPVNSGHHCQQCPDPVGCPLPELAKGAAKVRTLDDAVEQLDALLVEEARVKKRKELIRAYLESSGERAVQVNGAEVGWGNPGSGLDKKAVAAAGIDLKPFMKSTLPSFGRRKALK